MITLVRDGDLQVEAVEGFEDRARTIRFKVGEGITGKVVESGRPIVVPRVSKEPTFLNLAPRRPEQSIPDRAAHFSSAATGWRATCSRA